jgi:hypothetical protein
MSDELYILDLCDIVLCQKSLRQYRFTFLRGDGAKGKEGRKLPVDAYYPAFNLVIEYHEKQHSEAVDFFDKKITVSGISRGEQRKLYDQRRRDILPKHGLHLVEFGYSEFRHSHNRRLLRFETEDLIIIQKKIQRYIPKQ